MRNAFKLFFGAAVLACSVICSAAKVGDVPAVETAGLFRGRPALTNVTYKEADGEVLQFDISYPDGAAPKGGWPVIIYIHGGGWAGGDRREGFGLFNDEVRFYNSHGIALATASYRFARANPPRTIRECVTDVKDAARFIVKNSRALNVNPAKMGVYGHSAGGHLSMMAALAPDGLFPGDASLKGVKASFVCAVPMSGPTSFVDPGADAPGFFTQNPDLMTMRLGGTREQTAEIRRLVSPGEYLSKKSPPMLLIQGAKDDVVSPKAAEFMLAKAASLGAPVELFVSETGRHSFENGNHAEIAKARRDFFLRHLAE